MKRSYLSKLPNAIKSNLPAEGIKISIFLLLSTILMPMMLVGTDMISDGSVMAQMWPYTRFPNWEQVEQVDVLDRTLGYLFLASILVLEYSTLSLLRSNWLSTLLRNAKTTLMMESRELEKKDASVPLGNDH